MGALTHKQLVKRAGRWLRNSLHCSVVFEELVANTIGGEIPDTIGWVSGTCIVVECKTSHADFLTDKKKASRRRVGENTALGTFRFYLAPPNVIRVDELPEGWGLYEVHERGIKYIGGVKYNTPMYSLPFKSSKVNEVKVLLSAIRRLQISSAVFVRYEENEEEK